MQSYLDYLENNPIPKKKYLLTVYFFKEFIMSNWLLIILVIGVVTVIYWVLKGEEFSRSLVER